MIAPMFFDWRGGIENLPSAQREAMEQLVLHFGFSMGADWLCFPHPECVPPNVMVEHRGERATVFLWEDGRSSYGGGPPRGLSPGEAIAGVEESLTALAHKNRKET